MTEPKSVTKQIVVISREEEETSKDGSKGVFTRGREVLMHVAPLNVADFSDNLQTLCSQLGEIFERITPRIRAYDLDSIELTVELTAKGEVRLVGCVGTELKGGLKLSFRRTTP
jgi:hypothetical protein